METVLKEPTIVGGSKETVRTPAFNQDFLQLTEAEQLSIATIMAAIADGTALPATAYRRDHMTTHDTLLTREGIMHLHFSDTDDNKLLFVEQYDTYVVLIAISDHGEFKSKPKGLQLKKRAGTQSYRARQTFEHTRRQALKAAIKKPDDEI